MKKHSAFTLIELLVTIAVIVCLIAILIPSLAKARAASRRSACLSNTSGLARAFHLYVTDWDALLYYPIPYNSAFPNMANNQWINPLTRYGNGEKIRQCPEAFLPNPVIYSPGSDLKPWNQPGIGDSQAQVVQTGAYAFNGWFYAPRFVPPPLPAPSTGPAPVYYPFPTGYDEDPFPDDSDDWNGLPQQPPTQATPAPPPPSVPLPLDTSRFFRYPLTKDTANVPVIADSIWSEVFAMPTQSPPTVLTGNNFMGLNGELGQLCIARHARSINIAFYDGHAENTPLNQLWSFRWNATWPDSLPPPNIPR